MLNGVDKMWLVKSEDTLSLMAEDSVKIEDVVLFVRKVKVDPSVQLDQIRDMEWMMAKYFMCRARTQVLPVPKGNIMDNQEKCFWDSSQNV